MMRRCVLVVFVLHVLVVMPADCQLEGSVDCNFDQGFCGWNNFRWSHTTGRTASGGSGPTPDTGPNADHTSGSGGYIFLDASDGLDAGTAVLVSPQLSGPAQYCLRFWYNMNGAGMGSLEVWAVISFRNHLLWSLSGNQGDVWTEVELTLDAAESFRLQLLAVKGANWTGDAAIDDVSITNGSCTQRTTAAAATTTLPAATTAAPPPPTTASPTQAPTPAPVLQPRDAFFDCNRVNIDCGPGGTCVQFDQTGGGTCTCLQNASSKRINDFNGCVDPDDASSTCTTNSCGTFGMCVKVEGGTNKCFCDDEHYGALCDKQRIVVMCDADSMTIQVTPYGNSADGTSTSFQGRIYASGQSENATCQLDAQTTTVATFEKDFPYTGGSCGVQKIATGNSPTYELTLRVQHNPNVLLINDLKVIARCAFSSSQAVVSTGIIVATDADLNNDKTETTVVFPVQLDIVLANNGATYDTPAGATLKIGTDIGLRFFLAVPNTGEFIALRVEECNGQNANATKQFPIAANACPVKSKLTVEQEHIRQTNGAQNPINGKNGVSVIVPIKIFKFPGENVVKFVCTVKLCKNETFCASQNCNNIVLARYRRAADEDFELDAQVRVLASDDPPAEGDGSVSNSTNKAGNTGINECIQEPRTQTIIAVLGVIVLILLVACAVLTGCFIRRIRKNKGDNFDPGSLASSTQHFFVPRPRV